MLQLSSWNEVIAESQTTLITRVASRSLERRDYDFQSNQVSRLVVLFAEQGVESYQPVIALFDSRLISHTLLLRSDAA